jgi:hypothetical protein
MSFEDSPVINLTRIGNILKDRMATEKSSKIGANNMASFIPETPSTPPDESCPLALISYKRTEQMNRNAKSR